MIDDRAPAADPDDDDDAGRPTAYGVPKLRQQVLQRLADAFADDERHRSAWGASIGTLGARWIAVIDDRAPAADLELAEYERRVRAAELATTIGELDAVVADFPERDTTVPSRATGPVVGSGMAVTVMGSRDMEIEAAGDVPRQVINVMGETRIDLSTAPPGVYELRVINVMGEIQVAVPYGTQVNRTLWNLLSEVTIRPWKVRRSTGTRFTSHQINLAGFSLMGEVTIREESS